MSASNGQTERRKKPRARKIPAQAGVVWFESSQGAWEKAPAEIINTTDDGVCIRTSVRLQAGQPLLLEGGGLFSNSGGRLKARGIWCAVLPDGRFQVGLALDSGEAGPEASNGAFEDYYEVLEVNPSASFDTIHKIYRILAQRLHPDNPESGNDEHFKRLVKAYRALSEPGTRAAFDVARSRQHKQQFRLFDAESATPGLESEQRKRRGILALLYGKRMRSPEKPVVSLTEMEQLLAVPREHLEFPLWYLREQGWIARADNAQFSITVKGVEQAESSGAWQPPAVQSSRLIAAAGKA